MKIKHRGKPFAKGRDAVAICQRSGFKYLQSEMVFEPGTNYFVHRSETDGFKNLVDDPLNYAPKKMRRPELISLRYSFPEDKLSIGTIVSAEQLFLPSYASVSNQFIQYAVVSIGSGVSGVVSTARAAKFSSSANSQYVLVIFQGI